MEQLERGAEEPELTTAVTAVGEGHTVTRSTRNRDELAERLRRWLEERLGGRSVSVDAVEEPTANGMSSETLLVDATWDEGGGARLHRLVVRVAPDEADLPIFPTYDLEAQHRVMSLVAEHTAVPIPRLRWYEADPGPLGAAFFVMDRVDGRLPADVPPYTFEGWLHDADPRDRRRLQDAHVRLIAQVHTLDPGPLTFLRTGPGAGSDVPEGDGTGTSALRRHVEATRAYYDWAREGRRFRLLERAFDWLESNWPESEGDTVLSWGDSRIGNVIFDGFTPVAALDWEMAGVGPRGLDLGWTVFMHTFFQDIAEVFEMPGLPDMFRPDAVAATYEEATGVPAASLDLDFHVVYAALRHGIVMVRVHKRRVHFGEAAPVEDPDDEILHRARLEALIDGS